METPAGANTCYLKLTTQGFVSFPETSGHPILVDSLLVPQTAFPVPFPEMGMPSYFVPLASEFFPEVFEHSGGKGTVPEHFIHLPVRAQKPGEFDLFSRVLAKPLCHLLYFWYPPGYPMPFSVLPFD